MALLGWAAATIAAVGVWSSLLAALNACLLLVAALWHHARIMVLGPCGSAGFFPESSAPSADCGNWGDHTHLGFRLNVAARLLDC
jgi:hypothetical protein